MSKLRDLTERHPVPAALGLFAALAAVGRVAFYAAPASRDTGQYMYVGDVILDGGTPYLDAANNKGPANFVLWAFFRGICDGSPLALRLLLIAVTAVAALAVALYVAHYAGRAAGLLAGITLALLSSAAGFEGYDPSISQFGIAPMVGAWAIATRRGRNSWLAAGALASLAFLLNPAFGIAIPFVAWELWRQEPAERQARVRRIGIAAAGALAVAAPFAIWLGLAGALDDMVNQVFGQAERALGPGGSGPGVGGLQSAPMGDAPLQFLLDLPDSLLWIAGLAGCAIAYRDRRLRHAAVASALWIGAAWLRVELANYEFPNQYVPGLAGISAGIALGIASVWPAEPARRTALAILVLAAPLWTAVAVPQLQQLEIPADQRGNTYTKPVVDFLESSTEPGSTLQVAGYDPQVYWLADRRSPTRFFDSFGLSGRDDYVAERRRDLFADPPDAVAALPEMLPLDADLEELVATEGYRLAYDEGAQVWLRDPGAAGSSLSP